MTEFQPCGSAGGVPLVQHVCPRFSGAVFVSAEPSPDGDDFIVPMCGCRPC